MAAGIRFEGGELRIMKQNMLSVRKVQTAGVGWYADGGGLYLQVTPGGRSWVFRFKLHGRERYAGLGSLENVNLAEAREKAAAARKMRSEGIDPIEHRKAQQAAAQLAASTAMTFRQCAEGYIAAHRTGWQNAKHAAQWETSLRDYVHPVIGGLPVAAIDTGLVLKCLQPIWSTKTETASRVRGRIELVLDWAKARGYRNGGNPSRWRGHLDHLLPAPAKVAQVRHHRAMPFDELPGFMAQLRQSKSRGAPALEFLILTAARLGEVVNASWSEFDLDRALWTIPARRMKGKKEHAVPLSKQAINILLRQSQFDVPFPVTGQTLTRVLNDLDRNETVHGFRSSFRDWIAERTNYPNHVAEMALAHTIPSAVEAAYRRGDLFKKRRRLMNQWADYCGKSEKTPISSPSIIPLRRVS
jgi:integrase